ncbi:hypothetical protein TNCV_4054901 [Trichonephila clavipes]|nr:hypothetical protein TNCV_4054901 [Trichonephila clavipes]
MGKDTIVISNYRTSVGNVGLSLPVQYNASPDDNLRTSVTVIFQDATGLKTYPNLSPNQLSLRNACGTETTLILKKNTTPLISVQFLCFLHHSKQCHQRSIFKGRSAFITVCVCVSKGHFCDSVWLQHSKPRHFHLLLYTVAEQWRLLTGIGFF